MSEAAQIDPQATDASDLESVVSEPIRNSYEGIRDSVDHPKVRENWQGAHKALDAYRKASEEIDAMDEYTDEAKLELKRRAYDKHIPQAQKGFEQARAIAEETSKREWKSSIPFPGPDGERNAIPKSYASSPIKDAAELNAIASDTQHVLELASSGSLVDAIANRTGKRPKNIKEGTDNTLESLQALYADALEEGGIDGKVRCHAIIRACERLRVDIDQVVAPLRNKYQQQAFDRAQRYESQVLTTIPSGQRVTSPPDAQAMIRTPKTIGTYGSRVKGMVGDERRIGSPFAKKDRKRQWK